MLYGASIRCVLLLISTLFGVDIDYMGKEGCKMQLFCNYILRVGCHFIICDVIIRNKISL